MTTLQKKIIEVLLQGGSISGNPKYGYRLKDAASHPIVKFSYRTFHSVKPYLRINKGSFLLNRGLVRGISKRFWIKKAYLENISTKDRMKTGSAEK